MANRTDKAFKYQKLGHSRQLLIRNSAELRLALELDESLWAATVAPIESFHCDAVLLKHLDDDGDQFVKAKDLKKAISWTLDKFSIYDGIDRGTIDVSAGILNEKNAESLIATLGKFDSKTVALSAVRERISALEALPASAVGSVLPGAAKTETDKQLINTVIELLGGIDHPGGGKGINRALLKQFITEGQALQAWRKEGQEAALASLTDNAPLFKRLHKPLDRFFALCELVRLDPKRKPEFWPAHTEQCNGALESREEIRALLAACPVAEPNTSGILREDLPFNPFYAKDLTAFLELVCPVSGELDEQRWNKQKKSFLPYIAWHQKQPDTMLNRRSSEQLGQDLFDAAADTLNQLLLQSEASANDLSKMRELEKLLLYQQNLLNFANNFISIPMLYDSKERALFEEGTLIIDGRRFNLAMRVFDRKEHRSIADQGTMFVMYVEIFHQRSGRRYEVAVPATSGTQGGLQVGKRGIFEHVEGTEWTAQIVAIVDRPISFLEAVYAPFIRLGKSLTNKIESMTQNAEKKLDASGSETIGDLQNSLNQEAPPATSPGSMLAGGGIAIAAMGSSVAFIINKLAQLEPWQILFGLSSAVLAVLVPSLLIAGLRLRSRNISGILEGSRWGINSTMRLSRKQQIYFTQKPRYPR